MAEALDMASVDMRKRILDFASSHPKAEKTPLYPFFCVTPRCDTSEARYKGHRAISSSNIFVLTGPGCFSSCDQFAAIMKDNGIAKVVGYPPRGAHSPFRAGWPFKLANGEDFKVILTYGEGIRPNGEVLEGNPASVDLRVDFQEDYISTVLAALK